MRTAAEYDEVDRLVRWGLNDCQIARLTGISRGTVRDWRTKGPPMRHHEPPGSGPCGRGTDPDCAAQRGIRASEVAYAYLLGLYLGDGCLSEHERGVFRLRITLDRRYPGIITECATAIAEVRPTTLMRVGQTSAEGCMVVNAYWKHWPCLFPQHGPGRKHLRRIELAPWQLAAVRRLPARLLRGLIHSDGCRVLNRINGTAYPRYMFSNSSADIRAIFCNACDRFGVSWRRMNENTISVARRRDVARLDTVIGPKS